MFIPAIFFGGGGIPPPQKNLVSPTSPNGWQIVCSKSLFSAGTMNCQYITETFFLTDNKHGKLIAVKQSEGCKFMPEMLMRSPDPLPQWGPTSKGRERRGPTSKGYGEEQRDERGDGKRGEGNPPKVKVSRINTDC